MNKTKPVTQSMSERKILYINSYIWDLEKWMNLFAGGNGDADGREETCAHSKGGRVGQMKKIPPTHVNYQASDGELVRSCSEAQESSLCCSARTCRDGIGAWKEAGGLRNGG